MRCVTDCCKKMFVGVLLIVLAFVALAGCPKIGPNASFTVTPDGCTAPLAMQFNDTSDSGSKSITSWAWNFGDGETSSEQNPIHIYVTSGHYTVQLNVSTSISSDKVSRTITASRIWYVTPGGTGNGLCWSDSLGLIQDAVDAAYNVGGGEVWVAGGTYTANTNPVVTMKSNVNLYGGFLGNETSRDASDWIANTTIIDGESVRRCVNGANDAILDGFAVQNGYAYDGGGMYNSSSSPIVTNCTFRSNRAWGDEDGGGDGGGMHNISSSPEVTNCIFGANTADWDGGGMCNDWGSSPQVTNCRFSKNAANNGGGIGNFDSSPMVTNCTFSVNTAGSGGGMWSFSNSLPEVTNCIFRANTAFWCGGGIDNEWCSSAVLLNCTISENEALYGGGIFNSNSSPIVTNSILWGNSASDSSNEIYNSNTIAVVSYTCVEEGYDGIGNISTDPLLVATSGSNGRIRPGSPCINSGTSTGAPDMDIRGVARPQGGGVDMGAYELDDADGDGISDTWEQAQFGDLSTANADSDADVDGLSDLDESLYGTEPGNADTDGDGYTDGDDLAHGWDPTLPSGIRRVNVANNSGVEDGLTWATAFTSIQAAIGSIDGGELWVAAGMYTSTTDPVVTMKSEIRLYGGFAGTENSRNTWDWSRNKTIINGESVRRCVSGADDAVLDGFMIQNGYANEGGGMYNDDCSPVVTNCVFTACTAVLDGGGMCNFNSSPIVTNCTFSACAAVWDGGGICNYYSSPVVTNCTFSANMTEWCGGGIYNSDSSLVMTNCTFNVNSAGYGGGVYNLSSSLTLANCILWGDSASEIDNELFDYNSTPEITYSCVEGGYSGAGNISVDPLLINTLGSQGRIRPGSPCIDTGIATGAPDTDIRGVARPQGGGVDMGAYELDDSDGDGISDTWEQGQFGELSTADADSDTDGDGMADLEESLYGTDPEESDTDGDGVNDAAELGQGWDPTMPSGIRRVNVANNSGIEDGLTWATAYTSIQAAIDSIYDGEIWVAAGTYKANTSPVITMKSKVHLYGGFSGTENNLGARNWISHATIIDGEDVHRCVIGANSASLNGFTIQNGYAASGGGMRNYYASPVVKNCTFGANAGAWGGGMENCFSSPVLINCTFNENVAAYGGGMYNYSSSPVVTNCILWGDSGTSSGNEIYNDAADCIPTVTYSCIQEGYPGDGNTSMDPLIIATLGGNGRIRPDSLCINSGTAIGAPDTDIRGVVRPQGGGVDMGAYELDDSDGDGISDAWELGKFGNLSSAGTSSDADGDGLSDLDESLYGTEPDNIDTDCDGYTDFVEIEQGWEPTIPSGIRRVNAANSSGMEDGLTWATAYASIQAAIDALYEGEIWVASGTYTAITDPVVKMKTRIGIYGGFAGTESNRDERDWEYNKTVIDGEGIRCCVSGANEAVLDGFNVQNGYGLNGGGGMWNEYSSPAVENCMFSVNTTNWYGGGMCNDYSSPVLTNCTFSANTATLGAGMGNWYSSPILINCIFGGNIANGTCIMGGKIADGEGAGICNYYSSPALTNCTFSENMATYGGGMSSSYSSPVLLNAILWGDMASNSGNEVYNYNSSTVVTYSCVQEMTVDLGTGNINSDPLFEDADNGDYSLQSGSPCIDTGTATGAPSMDILGVARPQGSGYDMGAYEYK